MGRRGSGTPGSWTSGTRIAVGGSASSCVHEQALRYNPGDSKLERRCADLALELGRYIDAQRHLDKPGRQGPERFAGPTSPAGAELEDLLGQCERGLTRFDEAEKRFVQALEHDPRRVACYDRLARLLRTDLRRNQDADGTIEEMVAKNPKVGPGSRLPLAIRARVLEVQPPPTSGKPCNPPPPPTSRKP